MKGIPVTRETLALDVIDKVGPGGHYLEEEHTMAHFREIRYSDLFERMVFNAWESAGAKKFEQRLRELTLEKMKHRPQPLSGNVVKELDQMQANWK
jgi:trimethylamine--corrinoid protein Co-methyltransferase